MVFECRLFDGVALSLGGSRDIDIPLRKASALLSYLLLAPEARVERERIAGLLWSESPEATARTALRQCQHRLQKQLSQNGVDILSSNRHSIWIDRSLVHLDLRDIITQAETKEPVFDVEITPDMHERILYGYEDLDPSFTAWLHMYRTGWHERFSRALNLRLSDGSLDYATKPTIADAMFRLDPTSSKAASVLIETSLQREDLSGALSVYQKHWDVLDETWGEEPDARIQELVVNARQKRNAPQNQPTDNRPSTEPKFAAELPTLALKPFSQIGPWKHEGYLIDGFRRELTATLIKFREWVVIDEEAQGSLGGPRFIIDGNYQTDQHGFAELTVTLMDRRSGAFLMSETVTLDVEAWSATLRKIIRRTAVSLDMHITRRRAVDFVPETTTDPEAFEAWLRVRELLQTWRFEANLEAEKILQGIIEKSPGFAPAYASISSVLNTRHLSAPGVRRRKEWEYAALEYALKSVSIDPLNTRNHTALGWASAMNGVFNQAQLHFELAHDLNPGSPATLIPCAHGLSFCGQHDRAIELVEAAREIDPSIMAKNWGFIMCIFFFAGRMQEAVEAGEAAGHSILDLPAWKAAAQAMVGDVEEARRTANTFLELAEGNWHGELLPTKRNICAWFLDGFPIRKPADRDLLRRGLAEAGLTMG